MTPEGFIVVFLLVLGILAALVNIDIKRRKKNVVKKIFGDIKCCATKEGLRYQHHPSFDASDTKYIKSWKILCLKF